MAGSQWPSVLCHIDPCHVVAPQVIALDPSDKFAVFVPSIRATELNTCSVSLVYAVTLRIQELANLSLYQNYNMQSFGLHREETT